MLQIVLREVLQAEGSDTRRNVDQHKEIKGTGNGKYVVKYKILFFTFKISLKGNWLFKEK